VSSHAPVETFETHGCSIVLRRFEGPEARELFFSCQPPPEAVAAGQQAEAAYRAISAVLAAEGGSFGSVVSEMAFLRDLQADVEEVRAARRRVLAASEAPRHRPARIELGQPPLQGGSCLELLIQAVIPHRPPLRVDTVAAGPACGCAECTRSHGLVAHVGEEARFYASALYGGGESAYEQTLGMFREAENLLQRAGMEFRDVMRTWIHLREMDRDYPGLNRARREFFTARGIDPVPASTGIGGALVPGIHDISLSIYAVKAGRPIERTVMTTPTLNEAAQYGADFVRGMKVAETNRIALHVSGTASIDEAGRTAHVGDFESQADRMLVNVAALLGGQGASFDDVVYAITYLKHPADARRLREKLHAAGFEGFPNVLVAATVCRPELLCETEVLAVLPRTAPTPSDPGVQGS
jgi:enamine deaminase RidA (YjgF/YER057c/UK114 family)